MISKKELARKLLKGGQTAGDRSCFIGFDGFTDEIISVVNNRSSIDTFRPMTKISQLGNLILAAAGKSCNIELVVRQKKMGGNAPLLTQALLEGGHQITFAGAIGEPGNIEPLFQEMVSRCAAVIPLGPSGHSDALEFEDGKIILGKHEGIARVNPKAILEKISLDDLANQLDQADLFVSANWSMLVEMTSLWRWLDEAVVPQFTDPHRTRWLFVDLSDPAKRTIEDLQEGLQALKALTKTYRVILSLNEAEAYQLAKFFSLSATGTDPLFFISLAKEIRQKTGFSQILIHTTHFAAGVTGKEEAVISGPYTPKPLLTTGGGDHFNAGFCNALLYGLSLEEALLSGAATSGYYVRNGRSPTLKELAVFLESSKEIG